LHVKFIRTSQTSSTSSVFA